MHKTLFVLAIALAAQAGAQGSTPGQRATASPLSTAAARAADPLNFGFERSSVTSPNVPERWYTGGQGYTASLDTVAPYAGARSLRIQPTGTPPANGFGSATMTIPASAVAGKTVRLRAYIRTEGIERGYAGLWMRIDGAGGKVSAFDNMGAHGVHGTTPWTQYEITLNADTATTGIVIGAIHPGDGTAWYDAFSLELDGKVYGGQPSAPWQASATELAWVRDHATPLTTSDPRAPLDDLKPMGALVGDAHIVALGEGTHGTSEFFQMKHRLTEYLAREKGFTVFAIEANMPEARRVNEYVLTGRGDPRAALSGLYFWTWNTQEVLDMIEWMRAYNASGKGRMEFWGFDLQTPNVAMDSVRAFVHRADAPFVARLDSAYAQIDGVLAERRAQNNSPSAVRLWEIEAARVLEHLEANRSAYVAAGHDTLDVAWAIQNARIVVQAAGSVRGTLSRDSSMATNVQWIAAHHPAGTKMVLWAHNGHVARAPGWMGSHLAERYGSAMRVIGFALGDGEYTAVGPRGLTSYPAVPPEPGSVENVFRATGFPRFALDLRGVSTTPAAAWLAAPHDFRSIGAMATDNGFSPTRVAALYDALIYFDHTKASAELRGRVVP